MKKIRGRLGIAAATAALSLTGTVAAVPAHADPVHGYFNITTGWQNSSCLRPDGSNLGSEVHLHPCDSNSYWWDEVSSNFGGFRFVWMGPGANHGACLIPNWDKVGAPVVVTNGNNGAVCDQEDAAWSFNNVIDPSPYHSLVNLDGLTLDYDISANNRGLQLWTTIQPNTNQWFDWPV